jgi:hypothetical protein
MAGITSGGAAARWRGTFRLGSMATASTGGKMWCSHLCGHWPKCRRRCRGVVRLAGEEEEEAGGGAAGKKRKQGM